MAHNVIHSITHGVRLWIGLYLNQIRDFPVFWNHDLHCVDSSEVQLYDVLRALKGWFDKKKKQQQQPIFVSGLALI